MRDKNFLLGKGERLSHPVKVPTGGGEKKPPYSFSAAKTRIHQKLVLTTEHFSELPKEACPNNQVVALVTMHPRYLSKTDFPEELFKGIGLRSIGSRTTKIKPESWGISKHSENDVVTEQIFVAGKKESFQEWSYNIEQWNESKKAALQITKIEDITDYSPIDKIHLLPKLDEELLLEVVLQGIVDDSILGAFEAYAIKRNCRPLLDRNKKVQGLTFIPVFATPKLATELALFSFLRIMRPMPRLRPIPIKPLRSYHSIPVLLPSEPALSPHLRVAIFDGGIPDSSILSKWATNIAPDGIGEPNEDDLEHGIAVTSALLFGHIEMPQLQRPFCKVDHIRVLEEGGSYDLEILDVLDRILNHLDNHHQKYDFINLSLGPSLPLNDNEVTLWTAALDERLSVNDIFVTVAVGNDGEKDRIKGRNRIQPPSDGVNVLAVGACDSNEAGWNRAPYSCIGPGRRPGLIKPDGVAFGGSRKNPFMAIAPFSKPLASANMGTSYASPLVLRSAVGIKAYLGNEIAQRTIRALLIHRADPGNHPKEHVGWGRFGTNIADLITCEDDEAFILYQGELPLGKHLRAPLPIPEGLVGSIMITATIVIASEIDPQHPGAYTRSGLEVTFRPHAEKFKIQQNGNQSKHPQSKSFFSVKGMYGEGEFNLREDGYKWEPCLRNSKQFRANSLYKPCFDIYYHSREESSKAKTAKQIPYSLIISMKASKIPDFYNQVVRAYSNILVPLRPQVQVMVQV